MKAPYNTLKKLVGKKGFGPDCHPALTALYEEAATMLRHCQRLPLKSAVTGKTYFSFERSSIKSRAVNSALFDDAPGTALRVFADLLANQGRQHKATTITRSIYTVAMSCCAGWDILSPKDRKTQGTIFEWICAAIMQAFLQVVPERSQPVLNLDLSGKLPTDFIFNLGSDKPRLHLPVKTSTRDRVIQVWAHQRVLDGVYGVGRFLAMPIVLTETKLDAKTLEVSEICLPWQWRIYQMHIACLWNVFYLDAPAAHLDLDTRFPRVGVTTLGEGLCAGGRLDRLLAGCTE